MSKVGTLCEFEEGRCGDGSDASALERCGDGSRKLWGRELEAVGSLTWKESKVNERTRDSMGRMGRAVSRA